MRVCRSVAGIPVGVDVGLPRRRALSGLLDGGQEEPDILRRAILPHLELVPPQVRDRLALLVARDHAQLH